MNADRTNAFKTDLESITEDARAAFGNLSAPQLNWKADADSWSVAQCLDHLITINSLYFPIFERMQSGPVGNSFWEKYSPLSGFFGRQLIGALGPENPKKTKTSKKAYPSSSEIDDGIVERFAEHNRELGNKVANISQDVDAKTIITSPLSGLVTYSLDDCLTILVVHERRHLLQAKRVMAAEGYPAMRQAKARWTLCPRILKAASLVGSSICFPRIAGRAAG